MYMYLRISIFMSKTCYSIRIAKLREIHKVIIKSMKYKSVILTG